MGSDLSMTPISNEFKRILMNSYRGHRILRVINQYQSIHKGIGSTFLQTQALIAGDRTLSLDIGTLKTELQLISVDIS